MRSGAVGRAERAPLALGLVERAAVQLLETRLELRRPHPLQLLEPLGSRVTSSSASSCGRRCPSSSVPNRRRSFVRRSRRWVRRKQRRSGRSPGLRSQSSCGSCRSPPADRGRRIDSVATAQPWAGRPGVAGSVRHVPDAGQTAGSQPTADMVGMVGWGRLGHGAVHWRCTRPRHGGRRS